MSVASEKRESIDVFLVESFPTVDSLLLPSEDAELAGSLERSERTMARAWRELLLFKGDPRSTTVALESKPE